MRHLLIIILSILLLSSPLFGQETGVLFFSSENGEFVYSEEGDDDNVGKFEGEIENGKPNGQGTFTYGKGKGKGDKYVGEFKGGYKNGQGTYTWSDGDKYVGKFKDDKPNGQGTYSAASSIALASTASRTPSLRLVRAAACLTMPSA